MSRPRPFLPPDLSRDYANSRAPAKIGRAHVRPKPSNAATRSGADPEEFRTMTHQAHKWLARGRMTHRSTVAPTPNQWTSRALELAPWPHPIAMARVPPANLWRRGDEWNQPLDRQARFQCVPDREKCAEVSVQNPPRILPRLAPNIHGTPMAPKAPAACRTVAIFTTSGREQESPCMPPPRSHSKQLTHLDLQRPGKEGRPLEIDTRLFARILGQPRPAEPRMKSRVPQRNQARFPTETKPRSLALFLNRHGALRAGAMPPPDSRCAARGCRPPRHGGNRQPGSLRDGQSDPQQRHELKRCTWTPMALLVHGPHSGDATLCGGLHGVDKGALCPPPHDRRETPMRNAT